MGFEKMKLVTVDQSDSAALLGMFYLNETSHGRGSKETW
jgi:hypothetical protein